MAMSISQLLASLCHISACALAAGSERLSELRSALAPLRKGLPAGVLSLPPLLPPTSGPARRLCPWQWLARCSPANVPDTGCELPLVR